MMSELHKQVATAVVPVVAATGPNVRFQYKAVIHQGLLSSESGHSVKPFEQSASDPYRTFVSDV